VNTFYCEEKKNVGLFAYHLEGLFAYHSLRTIDLMRQQRSKIAKEQSSIWTYRGHFSWKRCILLWPSKQKHLEIWRKRV